FLSCLFHVVDANAVDVIGCSRPVVRSAVGSFERGRTSLESRKVAFEAAVIRQAVTHGRLGRSFGGVGRGVRRSYAVPARCANAPRTAQLRTPRQWKGWKRRTGVRRRA